MRLAVLVAVALVLPAFAALAFAALAFAAVADFVLVFSSMLILHLGPAP